MTHPTGTRLMLAAALSLGTGCARHVYSPPGRPQALESAATLDPGQLAAALEVGGHGAIFGPDLLAVDARVRGRLADGMDGLVEASLVSVADKEEGVETHPNIYALRSGAKLRAWRHLAFTAGLGGGASAGGGFASPDLGAVLAYENRYFVPFVSLRGYVSLPIGATSVVVGLDDGDLPITDTPDFTLGGNLTLGMRVPLRSGVAEHGSVLLGLMHTAMWDADEHEGFTGIATGLEVAF